MVISWRRTFRPKWSPGVMADLSSGLNPTGMVWPSMVQGSVAILSIQPLNQGNKIEIKLVCVLGCRLQLVILSAGL